MTDDRFNEIVAEYTEAYADAVEAEARIIAAPENAGLPEDVRRAKALLATEKERDRLVVARIALDQAKAEREDRWIAAHEGLGSFRIHHASD